MRVDKEVLLFIKNTYVKININSGHKKNLGLHLPVVIHRWEKVAKEREKNNTTISRILLK